MRFQSYMDWSPLSRPRINSDRISFGQPYPEQAGPAERIGFACYSAGMCTTGYLIDNPTPQR